MAKNIKQGSLNIPIGHVGVQTTYPTSPASGDPCLFGQTPGVAEYNMGANNITVINLDCIAELVVQGKTNSAANVAVTAGDVIYASQADPVVLSKDTTGVRFGIAFGNALTDTGADTRTGQLVASGNTTTTIRVLVGH
jgi:hypothetical protein